MVTCEHKDNANILSRASFVLWQERKPWHSITQNSLRYFRGRASMVLMALKALPKGTGKCWTFMISLSFSWDLAHQTHSWGRYNISRISVAKNRRMNLTADVSVDSGFWTNGKLNSDHERNNDFIKSVAFWYVHTNLVTSLLQAVSFSLHNSQTYLDLVKIKCMSCLKTGQLCV